MNSVDKPIKANHLRTVIPVVLTMAYLYWEAQASGNIRIDLFLFYPVLFFVYLISFWSYGKIKAILFSVLFLGINILFFIFSYDLFEKIQDSYDSEKQFQNLMKIVNSFYI